MLHLSGFFSPLLAAAATPETPPLGPFLRVLHDIPGCKSLVDFFTVTLGFGSDAPGLPEIFFAALLSFALMSLIAGLYKSTFRGAKLSQDYVHTLMILGIVVTDRKSTRLNSSHRH